ncbi:methyltransferase domain-containing protein [Phyllobacterium myrsinacearum]|uniref:Methyltransferase n=1 Tax=Phyllobacterium myrsinacearum TaxID=28101 RepID=A0A2S9JKK1_9HYPH|nr:methyltransferase domain-containing protein [Phyllobacterium myrsinacearum]PRD53485.1 hypothetical protein C5750_14075 [Phyllobacterium myrsinacearum]PWV86938.1 methyltransferase family protein [Phyllobacterium myrsinacearum]RZV07942.1 methyltransferase family protein [Phyllobacterium myrsinacearum]
MDLRHTALNGLNLKGKAILEIGPLNRPLVPRSVGKVYYADHCSTEDLKKKYHGNPDVPEQDICSVDINLLERTLPDAGKDFGPFDFVVASHVIEHVPNLVGWLRDIHAVLQNGGVLALVIPDKRYTFDFFRRDTEAWMIDEAEAEQRWRPSLRQVIDHFTNIVHADCGALWSNVGASSNFRPQIAAEAIEGLIAQYQAGKYIDTHCWMFRPDSFKPLLEEVFRRYQIGFKVGRIVPTPFNQLEFYSQLTKI